MFCSEHASPTSPNTHTPVLHAKERERDADGECGGHGEVQGNEFIFFLNLKTASHQPPPPGLLPTHKSNSDGMMESNYLREMR